MARWAKVILALVGLFLLYIIIFRLLIPIITIKNVFNDVVQSFVNVSGMSPWLVKGLVILLLIPFAWALLEVTRLLPRISGSLFHIKIRSYRKLGIFIIISYIGLFFLAMYFLSRGYSFSPTGEPEKYYWINSEGRVHLSDTPGIERKSGQEKKQVTSEIMEIHRRQEKGLVPKRIDKTKGIEFFDPITRTPKVWYYKDSQGNYEFFDLSGFHPIYGDELKPVSKKIVLDYENKVKRREEEVLKKMKEEEEKRRRIEEAEKRRLREEETIKEEKRRRIEEEVRKLREEERIKEEKRRRIEEEVRRLREEERRRQEKLAMRKAYIERHINPIIYNDPFRVEIGLLIVDKKTMASFQYSKTIVDKIRVKLTKENTKAVSDLFKSEFIRDGNFKDLYQGDSQDIFDLELKNHIDYLILGTKEAIFSKIPPLKYFISCTSLLDLKIYSAQTGEIIAINSLKEKGTGEDNWEAEQKAIEKIIEKAKIFIMDKVKGK